MKYLLRIWIIAAFLMPAIATAQDNKIEPSNIFDAIKLLRHKIYVTGETTGDFADVEKDSILLISKLITEHGERLLIEKNQSGQTPLILASMYGYHGIVAELLRHKNVIDNINSTDSKGLSAWHYSNLALAQTRLVCNPDAVSSNPFILVPILVTAQYYQPAQGEYSYSMIRMQLKNMGSDTDIATAKSYWLESCSKQDKELSQSVETTDDLLRTLTSTLSEQINNIYKQQK